LENGVWRVSPNNLHHSTATSNRRGIQFKGKHVYTRYTYLVTTDGSNLKFVTNRSNIRPATTEDAWFLSAVKDFVASGDYFYILEENGNVFRTTDLRHFRFVDRAPSNSVSIEVANNAVYVGTEEGKVFKSVLPEPSETQFIKYKNYLIPITSTKG